jgi:hypothetical protein
MEDSSLALSSAHDYTAVEKGVSNAQLRSLLRCVEDFWPHCCLRVADGVGRSHPHTIVSRCLGLAARLQRRERRTSKAQMRGEKAEKLSTNC